MGRYFMESDLGSGITGHLIIADDGEVIGIACVNQANLDYEPDPERDGENQQLPIEGEL